ncbi:HAMP domain-containing sensor histidine kinase [Romboutsia sedimentorum]|uniref:histidine kinase n=1 Tax=Romboutsia sedimentorum TaxID=1368474 RepID=A0ABT7EBB9_9FIRM|nr:HAMP domain-containing sensor histidine kinase [Romboutsia sedimentorum]MDK2564229.1 HAMP domain-containing sensor histidine kinase [Romboutsia sedimentorum]
MKNKTIKKDFYTLVLKIVIYTIISTALTYIFVLTTMYFTNARTTDYYMKYIHEIEEEVKEKGDRILDGNIIDVKKYNEDIQGEVVDLEGNHLYGEIGVKNNNFNVLDSINQDKYSNNYIYRYVGIMKDNNIKAIYIIKAPFSFIKNNFQSNKGTIIIYLVALLSPIIFFIIYLFLFTSKLYKSIYKNMDILLKGCEKISKGDFDFYVNGVQGLEFNEIQKSFNTMVKVLNVNIEELSKLDEERKIMISSVAHDIRTPITVIKGQIEIIEDLKDIPGYDINENMEIINKNCDKMTNLTDNLALFYKVDGECFLLRNEEIDLMKFLIDKELEIKNISKNEEIDIIFKIDLSKQKYILDSTMLTRVLDNIIFNSLRFTNQGNITLKVYDEPSTKKVKFECSDTGTGFKEKDPSKLFNAFYQNENYKNHFGLGLYISKKIVNNYNGTIKAYNNNLGGATIEFHILELKEHNNPLKAK